MNSKALGIKYRKIPQCYSIQVSYKIPNNNSIIKFTLTNNYYLSKDSKR